MFSIGEIANLKVKSGRLANKGKWYPAKSLLHLFDP